MKLKYSIIPILVLFVLCATCSQKGRPIPNQLTEAEIQAGWKLLFDGKTTDGWRAYNEKDVGTNWKVEDGTLTCLGKGGDLEGYIITRDQFDNFDLSLEWKISEGANSGIFYHVVEDDKYEAPYVTGPEYQLIDDVGFPQELQGWQQTGADYAMYMANERKELRPVGEWNTSRVLFDHGHVEHWLNGEKIVEFEAWSDDWNRRRLEGKWKDYPDYGMAKTGYIGFQNEEKRIWFRNIKIRPL
jgi:hypothetical protein